MASNPNYFDVTPEIEAMAALSMENSRMDPQDYVTYDVKRGLRDLNGKGVVAGLTEISDIIAKQEVNGQELPCDGRLYYRGVNVEDLVGAGAIAEGALPLRRPLICCCWASCPIRRSWPASRSCSPITAPCPETLCGMSSSNPPATIS